MADTSLDPPNFSFADSFLPMDTAFLDDLPIDLNFEEDIIDGLGFDHDIDFSFEDFISNPENQDFSHETGVSSLFHTSGSSDQGTLSNSPSLNSDDGRSDLVRVCNSDSPEPETSRQEFTEFSADDKCADGDGRVLNLQLPVSDDRNSSKAGLECCNSRSASDDRRSNVGKVSDPCSPDSANYSNCVSQSTSSSLDSTDQEIKSERENDPSTSKRKKRAEDENPNSRVTKFRQLSPEDVNSPSIYTFCAGNDEDEKRKARLMRNRESAQLSRQRKKHYVEELEDKIKSLHSTIAELNGKLSYLMAENANLRQQLGGGPLPPGMYAVPPPMGPVHFPYVPCPSYVLKPRGSQVPLLPIPKLKPQQPVSVPRAKKSESKKAEGKTKKVASVSFLGLLFFLLLFGGFFPIVNVRYGGIANSGRLGFLSGGYMGHSRGRVLAVTQHLNETDRSDEFEYELYSTKRGSGKGNFEHVDSKKGDSCMPESEVKRKEGFGNSVNSSEPLLASLYVPRNDKLVKIDGNLIIHSVLASEKSIASSRAMSRARSDKASAVKEPGKAGLAIPGSMVPAIPLSKSGRKVERHSNLYRSPGEHPKALPLGRGSGETYGDNHKSAATDGTLQQWFREGLAGPILNSGMCTEVFQFKVSANMGAMIPAKPVANISESSRDSTRSSKMKNRRILHPPIPLSGSRFNKTSKQSREEKFHGNSSAPSTVVVSVLVDPREVGDVDEVSTRPKSLSRIFVVLLMDSVKYVTYSCVLPLKGSTSTHLVAA